MHDIRKVTTEEDIRLIADLAIRIWNQHFVAIIGQGQVDYILEKFQSPAAISGQLNEGYEYYILLFQGEHVGYLALRPNEPTGKMMISKIYVDSSQRGAGQGRHLLDFVGTECQRLNLKFIWLTVNKFNTDTIAWYERRGFVLKEAIKVDIGGGYFMDDWVMESPV